MPISDYKYHVLDFETTDFAQNPSAEIAEIALLTVHGIELVDIFHSFYSIVSISEGAAAKNGLSVEKLKGFPSLKDPEQLKIVRDQIKYPIFAHNAYFERGFLGLYNLVPDYVRYPMVCTLASARGESIKPINNKLETWLEWRKIPHRPHTALSDAFGLYKLILKQAWYTELDRINLGVSRPKREPY